MPVTPGRREPVVGNQCRAPQHSASSRPIHVRQDVTSLATTCQSVVDLQNQFVSYLTWPSKSSSSGIADSAPFMLVERAVRVNAETCDELRRPSQMRHYGVGVRRRWYGNPLSPNAAHGRVDSGRHATHWRSRSLCLVGQMELLAGTGSCTSRMRPFRNAGVFVLPINSSSTPKAHTSPAGRVMVSLTVESTMRSTCSRVTPLQR
jgi:hypothetical protein